MMPLAPMAQVLITVPEGSEIVCTGGEADEPNVGAPRTASTLPSADTWSFLNRPCCRVLTSDQFDVS